MITVTMWGGRHISNLVLCHSIEVSIRIHKLTYLGNVSVGHDPLTQQEGLGLLLPKGEHTSLRGVFSLGLYGLESRQGPELLKHGSAASVKKSELELSLIHI